MSQPLVFVVGNGAVSAGLCQLLTKYKATPRVIGRQGPIAFEGLPVATDDEFHRARVAFFAVKAYDLAEALEQHCASFSPGTAIIPIGNGWVWDRIKPIADHFPELRWRAGFSTVPVTSVDGKFAIKGEGIIAFGDWPKPSKRSEEESYLIRQSQEVFRWDPDILQGCRRKWLFNTALNTLVAANRLPKNGSALDYKRELRELFDEAYRLGETRWGAWSQAGETLFQDLLALIHLTRDNENSMAADLRLGRRTESEYLAGLAAGKPEYACLNAAHATILRA